VVDEKPQRLLLDWWYVADVGEGGLGGRVESARRADMAEDGMVVGVTGGEKCVEPGLDGAALGTMSRGSGLPAE
jgi:hypothetical protein